MKTFVVDTDVASLIFRQLPQAVPYEKAQPRLPVDHHRHRLPAPPLALPETTAMATEKV